MNQFDPLGLCNWDDPGCIASGAVHYGEGKLTVAGGKAASLAISVGGQAVAVKNTVVRSAPWPFVSSATKVIPYGVRLGIGATAGTAGQLIADSGKSLFG